MNKKNDVSDIIVGFFGFVCFSYALFKLVNIDWGNVSAGIEFVFVWLPLLNLGLICFFIALVRGIIIRHKEKRIEKQKSDNEHKELESITLTKENNGK